jgi:hypothetical protein
LYNIFIGFVDTKFFEKMLIQNQGCNELKKSMQELMILTEQSAGKNIEAGTNESKACCFFETFIRSFQRI